MAEILSTLSSDGKGTPTNGGQTYTLMSLWQADQAQDLVAGGNTAALECYNDWPSGLADSSIFTAWVTSETSTVTIRPAVGEGHGGVPGAGFYMNYVTSGSADTLRVNVGGLNVIGLELRIASSNTGSGSPLY
jgi:hypothetical protein